MKALFDRPKAEKLLADAEVAAGKARDALRDAEEQLAHAKDKHQEVRSDASRRGVAYAKVDLETAEDDVRRAEESLTSARAIMEKVQDEEDREAYARERDGAVAVLAQLVEHRGVLVALDRQVDQAVLEHARLWKEASDHYDRAEAIAQRKHLLADLDRVCRRPSLPQVRLDVNREVTVARLKEDREPLAPAWLAQADLRQRDLTAEEIAKNEAFLRQKAERARHGREQQIVQLSRLVGAYEGTKLEEDASKPPAPPAPVDEATRQARDAVVDGARKDVSQEAWTIKPSDDAKELSP